MALNEDTLRDMEDLNWVNDAACVNNPDVTIDDYFVQAGHAINEAALETCRTCPVRAECLTWAYRKQLGAGYFGGLSHGTRKKLTLEQALAVIENDTP